MKHATVKLSLCMLVLGISSMAVFAQPAPTPGPNDMYMRFADFPNCGTYRVLDTLWYGAVVFNPSYTETKYGELKLEIWGPGYYNALKKTATLNLAPRESRTIDMKWKVGPRSPSGYYRGTFTLKQGNRAVHVEQQQQNCIYVDNPQKL